MSARCEDCKRFASSVTEIVLIPPSPVHGGSYWYLCARCLRLFDEGWEECFAEVIDRHGETGPCNLRAFDVLPDPEEGVDTPVCRKHFREWSAS